MQLAPTASFWRVEHKELHYDDRSYSTSPWRDIRKGPYQCGIKSLELYDAILKNEPSKSPLKFKNKQFDLAFKWLKPLPASWVNLRPGPREDPYLREFWYSLSGLNCERTDYIFGFDSMAKLNSWFFDDEERAILNKYDFTIGKYKSKYCIHGYRQSIMPVNKQFIRVGEYAL